MWVRSPHTDMIQNIFITLLCPCCRPLPLSPSPWPLASTDLISAFTVLPFLNVHTNGDNGICCLFLSGFFQCLHFKFIPVVAHLWFLPFYCWVVFHWMNIYLYVVPSHSVMSDSLWPHGHIHMCVCMCVYIYLVYVYTWCMHLMVDIYFFLVSSFWLL